MKPPTTNINPQDSPARRQGVTLIEVLMSLMIMSIGISAVAVLFPISVLRSIQATQLTNGAVVKHNVEAMLDARPDFIFDPDGDGNLDEHFRAASSRNYIVDPVGFYTNLADFNAPAASEQAFGNRLPSGQFGASTPVQRFGGRIPLSNGLVFDTDPMATPPSALRRAAWRLAALNVANQGDGWETMRDLTPKSWGDGFVEFSTDEDLSDIPTTVNALPIEGGSVLVADPGLYRMILFSEDGKFSQAVPLVSASTTVPNRFHYAELAGQDVNASGSIDQRTLPVEFRVDSDFNGFKEAGEEFISRVVIQSRKLSDYSWMLNIRRRGDGLARTVEVVVRFNNGVSATDETLYEATVIGGSRFIAIRSPARTGNTTVPDPPLQKGGYLFDTANGKWRRISNVRQAPFSLPVSSDDFDFLVTVDQFINTNEGAGGTDSSGPFTPVMSPTGIIDVYPMGSRTVPRSVAAGQF